MKKISFLIVVVFMIATFFILEDKIKGKNGKEVVKDNSIIEKRGVFISYIEYMNYFDNLTSKDIKLKVDEMIDNLADNNFNLIILQVRPFSDAIYKSSIYPMSYTVTGKEGVELDFDLLEYFITEAHLNNMEIHAWVNPYRIRNTTDISSISNSNPCIKWLGTNKVKIIDDKGIFYNPASSEVIDLVVSGIEEIVRNYDVDGIHLDDYFYPDDTIDLEDYEKVKNTILLKDFRLNNTNTLIKRIYSTIKSIDPNIKFGISPEGNIENNYDSNYADVKTWLKEDGYIDYIMPQIYYGFSHSVKPYIETLNEWNSLIKNDVFLVPALALYKSGTLDSYAKDGVTEWMDNDNIISNQILVSREISNYKGFILFRYGCLEMKDNTNLVNEVESVYKLLEKKTEI